MTASRPLLTLCRAARPEEPDRGRRWSAILTRDGAEVRAVMLLGDGALLVGKRGGHVRAAVYQSGLAVAGPVASNDVCCALVALAGDWPSVAPEEWCCVPFRGVACPRCGARAKWATLRSPGTPPQPAGPPRQGELAL
jgi:hypothetical protein